MTERRPLVRIGGRLKDLPVGDTLPDRTSVNGETGTLTLRLNQAMSIVGAFDPTNSAPTATFSNAGRTVTFASHSSARVAATQPAHPGGAVRYFEMTFDSGTSDGDCAVGVVGAHTDISHQIGYNGEVHEVGMFQNTGRIYSANAFQATSGAFYTVGDTVGVAVNATTRKIWFRTNGGDWNGDDLANPLTGTGGITIQGTGSIFPAVCSPEVSTFTFNPAATFPGATPWGEYSVDGSVSPTDVELDNPVAGQVLMFNGVAWENANAPASGITWSVSGSASTLSADTAQIVTAAVNKTLPASVAAGQQFIVHAKVAGVKIMSNGNVITGVGSGNNLTLAAGETAHLVASGSGTLEIV